MKTSSLLSPLRTAANFFHRLAEATFEAFDQDTPLKRTVNFDFIHFVNSIYFGDVDFDHASNNGKRSRIQSFKPRIHILLKEVHRKIELWFGNLSYYKDEELTAIAKKYSVAVKCVWLLQSCIYSFDLLGLRQ